MNDPFPAEQGAYDYLCSIYTIINAHRWQQGRADDPDSIFDSACLQLFRDLVAAALRDMTGLDLITRGPDAGQVAGLIRASGLDAAATRDPAVLDRHLGRAGACAIIHFSYEYETGRPDHYSVLIRHAGRECLLDSYRFGLQSRDGWRLRFTPETELPQGAVIRHCWLIAPRDPAENPRTP